MPYDKKQFEMFAREVQDTWGSFYWHVKVEVRLALINSRVLQLVLCQAVGFTPTGDWIKQVRDGIRKAMCLLDWEMKEYLEDDEQKGDESEAALEAAERAKNE